MEREVKMPATLPNDVARCAGVGSDEEGWREGCDDVARRILTRQPFSLRS